MALKGIRRQQKRVEKQQIASQENRLYYQADNEWKTPSAPAAMQRRRRLGL